MKKKSYTLLLMFLAAAVALAAIKNLRLERPEAGSARSSAYTENKVGNQSSPSYIDEKAESGDLLVGVWIPYMSLQADGTENGFKTNFDEKLCAAVNVGANAVFVHVRSFADSMYPSSIEPWSHILTGTQGKDPGFDPLEYMLQRTHEAGLAFHAWINPLRISTGVTPEKLSENSFYVRNREKNPHFFMEYEGGIYYNPAVSDVRERIADVTAEIAERYDVDGIHFDDYFYPAAVEALDSSAYKAYTDRVAVPLSLEDWRTANINTLISTVYQKIKRTDAQVVFGISPQGNLENNKRICADVYTWCAQNGYIDYICPQLYYSFANSTLPFENALQTWTEMPRAEGVDLYIGLAVYKAGTDADDGTWLNSDRNIAKQIELSAEGGADGIVLYAVDHLDDDTVRIEMQNAEEAIGRWVS